MYFCPLSLLRVAPIAHRCLSVLQQKTERRRWGSSVVPTKTLTLVCVRPNTPGLLYQVPAILEDAVWHHPWHTVDLVRADSVYEKEDTDRTPPRAASGRATVRASHLLVKHRDSGNPKCWKESNVTRTKSEAQDMCNAFRETIATSSDLPSSFAALVGQFVAVNVVLHPQHLYAQCIFAACQAVSS